ncbi:tRNA uracil 4-sulfurtransferase ThiI [Cytobacillus sp. IB215665]|uniref:tRNA uracil 4-sulfurtransferase ThiI n=1 Tax=Cytobacillus sp. IB215665 TaxID=3097357 RepID=UPI002A17E075|nr:tRNA uracil 4-sulfurtransferase ThiI [Cytobacillus sp. IB215665]MDX8367513.1 tRNA uracil 4-sulfurtransferase ThiI [Cytobacillus sp. IB215665]
MQYEHILIRYGELSTKKRNRNYFVNRLKKNIKGKLREFENIEIEKQRDRMYIKLNNEPYEKIVEKLSSIFGIHSFSLAIKTLSDIEKIKEGALEAIKELNPEGKTFKVTAKRANKQFPLNSNELNYEIGSHILRNIQNLTVNVHEPDINLRVEVRHNATYITFKDISGAGGFPVGTSGKAMLMLSGGIDSPVAGYLAMKRGLEVEAVHFYSPPFTSERSKQKVIDLAKKLTEYTDSIKLHIVPFTNIQQVIQQKIPDNYTMTSTRRLMLQITDQLRQKNDALAIINGESLGQVASQTLESMYTINEVTSTPIIRPLITMDKLEIIDISKQIDTHDISILPYEDCCTIFTPTSPKTKPKRDKINHFESFVDFDSLISEAVSGTETIVIRNDKELTNEENIENLF